MKEGQTNKKKGRKASPELLVYDILAVFDYAGGKYLDDNPLQMGKTKKGGEKAADKI